MRYKMAVVLVSLVALPAMARMTEPPKSFGLRDKAARQQIQVKILPGIDVQKLLEEDRGRGKERERPTPQRFAIPADVVFTPDNSGTWTKTADGRIWRLAMRSPGAVNMNLGITRFSLPEGGKLWIYGAKREDVNGPYTQRDRSPKGSLWTPIVRGDEIIVELFLPGTASKAILEITKVNRGYRGFAKDNIPGGGGEGSCEIDVVCSQGAAWPDQIRSVGVYTLNGSAQCSGALINDTALDMKPYFLSANHCAVDTTNDDTVVVYWNFQSPTCGMHGGGSIADNQTGSTYRANNANSDFLLLELNSPPPAAYDVYHAGWDATGNTPPSTVGIHHPRCDVKSISLSNSAPETTAYYSDVVDPNGTHWRTVWDNGTTDSDGVTEPGSSGSPLFETTNHRIIGQLHGGPSACGATGTDLHDFYGRFSVSFTGDGTTTGSLEPWLDPVPTGQVTLDGDPHITTEDGVPYDFQGGGEYVALREADGSEVQVRQTPVSTTFFPAPNAYTGIASCVSLNTAVAARVNGHRVSLEPNISGVPDPSGLQVRVDGTLETLGAGGLALGSGGRILDVGGSYEIQLPSGTQFFVTPLFWNDQGKWFLNVDAYRGSGARTVDGGAAKPGRVPGGLMASIAAGSWLPVLSDGTTVGPKPASVAQRYKQLYHEFGDSWRVNAATSLFDYKPGTSTGTFTFPSWPTTQPPCNAPASKPAKPISVGVAQRYCADVVDRHAKANCVFDVAATGEPGFAKLYLRGQRIAAGVTVTVIDDVRNPTQPGATAEFVAIVEPRRSKGVPAGTVEFMVDGKRASDAIKLDEKGRAPWRTHLESGRHAVVASYMPAAGSEFLPSQSGEIIHTVTGTIITGLRLQAGSEDTPCPPLDEAFSRRQIEAIPLLHDALTELDKACSAKEEGFFVTSATVVRCEKERDARPAGIVNVTCGR